MNTKRFFIFRTQGLLFGFILAVTSYLATNSYAAVSSYTMSQFTSYPINVTQGASSVTPNVLIATSKDHQLYFKAYNDYSDLDGDGNADITYTHNIDYYGYFDSYKCYDYSAANSRFEPAAINTNKYCSGNWSGNFLNWATMARIDAIRKILFGGHRRVDSSSDTVLERAFIPTDIHSFAKYYSGSDINQLTPFSPPTTPPTTTSTTSFTPGNGSKKFTTAGGISTWQNNDYVVALKTTDKTVYMGGKITSISANDVTINVAVTSGSSSNNNWTLYNMTRVGITICNTTIRTNSSEQYSENITAPPLARVAVGNYSFWNAGEVWQCKWTEENSASNYNTPNINDINDYFTSPTVNNSCDTASPAYNTNNCQARRLAFAQDINPTKSAVGSTPYGDFVVRVHACVSSLIGTERCKQYPSGNLKPIGLLQSYGDTNQLKFGMVSGTYGKHNSGGDLTANLGSLGNEIDITGDGHFKQVYMSAGGPETNASQSRGLINAWSLYRIKGYDYTNGNYNSNQADGCPLSVNFFGDQSTNCTNWGNPFAEIYLTGLLYYGGNNSPTAFQANDTSKIPGLNYDNGVWTDPLDSTNYCAQNNIVAFNTSNFSVDADELDTSSYGVKTDLGSSKDSTQLTDLVGTGEGISGKNWFIGQLTSSDTNKTCTSKTITNLGTAQGLCPEGPDQKGSFRIAGLAWYAHTNDIRPSTLTGNRALTGDQKVTTYAVELSSGNPSIKIPVPGTTTNQYVTILPACRDQSKSNYSCTLADFKIMKQHQKVDPSCTTNCTYTGKFLAIWEDSLQGNDYDLDAGGTYEYTIDANTITVKTGITLENLGYSIGHGYIIGGTNADGLHIHSGTNSFNYTDPISGKTGCTNCCGVQDSCTTADKGQGSSNTYTIGNSTAGLLNSPLWYAAKWGGFTDKNSNNIPDLQSEWDKQDTNLHDLPDGVPDNFFYASNPAYLEDSLNKVFLSILQRVSSGTAAAAVSSTASGLGSGYQAYYEPSKQDTDGNKASWVGNLRALWLDNYGRLREDGNQDAILNGYDLDPVIEFFYDETDSRTKVRRYSSSNASTYAPTGSITAELDEIKPIWNARDQLYYRTANLATQRSWNVTADNGRYILTNFNTTVNSGDLKDFTATALNTASYYGLFDVANKTTADNLINFIRGVEGISGSRNRTVDYDNNGTTEAMRLGDIVNSTPTVVATPQESFDLLYGDTSYATFRKTYAHRRHVVYVGANDGMLHAFNGGFYDVPTSSFKTSGTQITGAPALEHPLGSELWAYIPGNLLPHLKWLQDPNYTHVYYVDGKPRVFDVKIFTEDDSHPGGWGTILVVGMNFGGGAMNNISVNGTTRNFKSAYSILDITNPEETPKLLAEIQLPDGSFTTGYPTAMTFKCAATATGCTDDNQWYLMLGSGPNNFTTGESNTTPTLYVYDLKTRNLAQSYLINEANTFLGNPVTADWDLDYRADNVYFGLIGPAAGNVGKLMRFNVKEKVTPSDWVAPHVLLDVTKPVLATPIVTIDEYLNHWIFFGTGRLLASADKLTTAQQALYGIKDKNTDATNNSLAIADLIDASNINVYTDGTVDTAPSGITTFQGLKDLSDSGGNANPTCSSNCKWGWMRNLTYDTASPPSLPSERNLVQMALVNSLLFAPAYTPNNDICAPEGKSKLYALYYKTGTAYFDPSLGTSPFSGKTLSLPSVDLGRGFASTPTVHSGSGMGPKKVTVLDQGSTGAITNVSASTTSSVRSGEVSWREYQQK